MSTNTLQLLLFVFTMLLTMSTSLLMRNMVKKSCGISYQNSYCNYYHNSYSNNYIYDNKYSYSNSCRKLEMKRKDEHVPSIPFIPSSSTSKLQQLNSLVDEYKNNDRNVFDDTIQFPAEFLIKIVGVNEPSFLSDMLSTIAKCTGSSPTDIKHSVKETSGGKYVSISATPLFSDSAKLYSTYEEISKDNRVKFMV